MILFKAASPESNLFEEKKKPKSHLREDNGDGIELQFGRNPFEGNPFQPLIKN